MINYILQLILMVNMSCYNTPTVYNKVQQIKAEQQIQPTLREVYDYMIYKDILYPDIHLQIIIVESGWLKKLKHKNNLCSWRNKDKTYKHFDTWQESIDFLKVWQDNNYCNIYLSNHKPGNYWDFICWSGWKNGTRCDWASKKYVKYCQKINLNFLDD